MILTDLPTCTSATSTSSAITDSARITFDLGPDPSLVRSSLASSSMMVPTSAASLSATSGKWYSLFHVCLQSYFYHLNLIDGNRAYGHGGHIHAVEYVDDV